MQNPTRFPATGLQIDRRIEKTFVFGRPSSGLLFKP